MVDGITPRTTDLDRAELRNHEHLDDACSVVAEPWTQWVIEDRFSDTRPALDTVGADIVEDVEPYELVKLRMLNASHQVVAHLGRLLGLEYVHEVLADRTLAAFLDRYLQEEAAPTIQAPPGLDLDHYRAVVLERFANGHVRDTLARQCTDTSDRIPTFLLPVVRDLRRREKPFSFSAAVIAAWALSCEGTAENGDPLDLVDRRSDALARRARSTDPTAFLDDREIFGDLTADNTFVSTVTELRHHLRAAGVRGTVEHLLG
jgi:mannitol 2-dehydrogenase